jgi:hypothetical protein
VIAIQSQIAKPTAEKIIPSDVPNQRMHDASRFPLVRLRRRAVQPGYAFAWGAEMQRLLALKAPFVIVAEYCAEEPADDLRLRSAWLRANRTVLAMYCRGLIVIEPRIEARASTRQTVREMCKDSDLRMVVVSGVRVANELAPVFLKHSGPDLSKPPSIDKPRLQMP